ncbi:UNVERIFIED_CONTAM: hypothetical protein PYX00_002960 [Menopon gallinae]|uniref:Uncharacterized protein n=1 Tax=Menopon gallinae TaxID=328185 RepID=A0AAW2HZK2_9NEOP
MPRSINTESVLDRKRDATEMKIQLLLIAVLLTAAAARPAVEFFSDSATPLPVVKALEANPAVRTEVVGRFADLDVSELVFRPLFVYRLRRQRRVSS